MNILEFSSNSSSLGRRRERDASRFAIFVHLSKSKSKPMSKHPDEPKIYLLPNLMTAGNLCCGFFAILMIF